MPTLGFTVLFLAKWSAAEAVVEAKIQAWEKFGEAMEEDLRCLAGSNLSTLF